MILYLDTSSLGRLYGTERGSDQVRALVVGAAVVTTSRAAYPELRAALARRRRERALRPAAFRAAKDAFEADWSRYVVVDVSAAICRDAGDLAEQYRLRGFRQPAPGFVRQRRSRRCRPRDEILERRRPPQSRRASLGPHSGQTPLESAGPNGSRMRTPPITWQPDDVNVAVVAEISRTVRPRPMTPASGCSVS